MTITPEARALVEELWDMAKVQEMFEVAQRHLDEYAEARAQEIMLRRMVFRTLAPPATAGSSNGNASPIVLDAELSY